MNIFFKMWLFSKKQYDFFSNIMPTCRKIELDPYLLLCTKINFKWVKDQNVKLEIIEIARRKHWQYLHDIDTGKDFINKTPFIPRIKVRNRKVGFYKTKI